MPETVGRERRRSPRGTAGIKVKILHKNIKKLITMCDVSFHGALLKTPCSFQPGEIIDLKLHLPVALSAIDVKARIVRSIPHRKIIGRRSYDIGVEILNLDRAI